MQFRKVIHISGVLIPVFAGGDFLGKNLTVGLLVFGLAVYLFLEAIKPKISPAILSLVYRENEIKGFAVEPLSYIISVLSLISLSFFIDEKLCFAAIAALAAGDGFAGVIGRRYGKHRLYFSKDKSWEGSISGFIAASLTGFYYAGPIAIAGSAFGMLAGAVSKHDNIAVPYAALIAMVLAQWIATLT
ncbi:phosphatidate cytidylyltransferase familyprotein [groundwater metagenome]